MLAAINRPEDSMLVALAAEGFVQCAGWGAKTSSWDKRKGPKKRPFSYSLKPIMKCSAIARRP